MVWHPDIPDIPISKPEQVARLEKMDRRMLDSMPGAEVDEIVHDVVQSLADTYRKEMKKGNYKECVEVVSVGLTVTGAAIGGKVGNALVAASETAAHEACRLIFPAK